MPNAWRAGLGNTGQMHCQCTVNALECIGIRHPPQMPWRGGPNSNAFPMHWGQCMLNAPSTHRQRIRNRLQSEVTNRDPRLLRNVHNILGVHYIFPYHTSFITDHRRSRIEVHAGRKPASLGLEIPPIHKPPLIIQNLAEYLAICQILN